MFVIILAIIFVPFLGLSIYVQVRDYLSWKKWFDDCNAGKFSPDDPKYWWFG
jgi:hypothetical protein